MRLGIAKTLAHSTPRDWAEKHSKAGLSAVVFPLDCRADDREILDYKKAADDYGLVVAEVGAWCNLLDSDERKAAENLDFVRRSVALAEKTGALCTVNISGSLSPYAWDGGDERNFSPRTFERVAQIVTKIVAEADRSAFTLEPMPWTVPYDADNYLKLLRRVNDRRFAVHMDAVNMINSVEKYFFQTEFLRDVFLKLGDKIVSAHLKDVKLSNALTLRLEERPPLTGDFATELYLRSLNAANSDTPIIIEHLATDEEYLLAAKRVRNAFPDLFA